MQHGHQDLSLDDNVLLIDQADRDLALRQLTASFSINLQALSLLALLVAWFLMHQALSLHFLRRRSLVSQLRLMGVRRGQLRWRLLRQAMLLGAGGSLLGLVIGWLLAQGLIGLLTTTMDDLYGNTAGSNLLRSWWLPPTVIILGLGASITASWLPDTPLTTYHQP